MKVPNLPGVALLMVAVLLIAGCEGVGSTVRKATYPPGFLYVSGEELRSTMHRLGFQLNLLEATLTGEVVGDADQQQQALAILREIENIATTVKAGEGGSNHPFLQDFMGNFVSSVTKAKIAASQNPPRYYLAGRVSGGCVNCHDVNRR